MTDRMFLVDAAGWPSAVVGDEVEVTGPEGRHAVTVVRVHAGETVLLGGRGRRAEATVTHTGRDAFSARLDTVGDEPDPDPRLVLVQALAKGGRDDSRSVRQALRAAAAATRRRARRTRRLRTGSAGSTDPRWCQRVLKASRSLPMKPFSIGASLPAGRSSPRNVAS